ncbi:MAG: TRAP transporter small permease subunit [Pseudomonadota bacterium]
MRLAFLSLADRLHRVTGAVCLGLMLIMLSAQVAVVILRYVFAVGFLELQGVVNYAFAVLVMLGIPVALRLDKHVRVDVFRRLQSSAVAKRFDHAGIVLLLIPVFCLTLSYVMPDIIYSWSIAEGAIETGGLPGYFLVKTALPVACVLMVIQGVAVLIGAGDGA